MAKNMIHTRAVDARSSKSIFTENLCSSCFTATDFEIVRSTLPSRTRGSLPKPWESKDGCRAARKRHSIKPVYVSAVGTASLVFAANKLRSVATTWNILAISGFGIGGEIPIWLIKIIKSVNWSVCALPGPSTGNPRHRRAGKPNSARRGLPFDTISARISSDRRPVADGGTTTAVLAFGNTSLTTNRLKAP